MKTFTTYYTVKTFPKIISIVPHRSVLPSARRDLGGPEVFPATWSFPSGTDTTQETLQKSPPPAPLADSPGTANRWISKMKIMPNK